MVDIENQLKIEFFESHFGNGDEQAVTTAATAIPSPSPGEFENSTRVYSNAHHSQIRRSSDNREEDLLLEEPHERQLRRDEYWYSSPPDGLERCLLQSASLSGNHDIDDRVTFSSALSTNQLQQEIADALGSVSFQRTTIPHQSAGGNARDSRLSGFSKDAKLGGVNKESFPSNTKPNEAIYIVYLFKRGIIARDKLEHVLYIIPANKYGEIFPKIKKNEALVYHGTEFPMGEEDKTMLHCSLYLSLEIAEKLYVMFEMVRGRVFSIEEPHRREVTVGEILSKSHERITAGFSLKCLINCLGNRDRPHEDRVRVTLQSGSTTLRLIFPVAYHEASVSLWPHGSSVTSMPDQDRKALRSCHVALLDNIGDAKSICHHLYQHEIFSSDDIEEVDSLTRKKDRNAYVLRAIQTRGNVLDFFIKVMQSKRENQGAAAILQAKRHHLAAFK